MSPSRSLLIVLASLGILAWAVHEPPDEPPLPAAPKLDLELLAHQIRQRVEPSLDWAHEESLLAVNDEIQPLVRFFQQAKQRTPAFAEAVLSWKSKWRLVADQVPGTSGERHKEFVRREFAETLFVEQALAEAVEQVTARYGERVRAIENEMLVRMRADLANLPVEALPNLATAESMHAAFDQAIERAMAHASAEVRADVAALVLAVVAEEVLAQAAVRLGVSAGILGAGAGSSWATLGVGLVVGLIIDAVVTSVWDWWADPQGNLVQELDARLDEILRLVVEGDRGAPGMRPRLIEYARTRDGLRREAIEALIGLGDNSPPQAMAQRSAASEDGNAD